MRVAKHSSELLQRYAFVEHAFNQIEAVAHFIRKLDRLHHPRNYLMTGKVIELMFDASHDGMRIKCGRSTGSRTFEVQAQAQISAVHFI